MKKIRNQDNTNSQENEIEDRNLKKPLLPNDILGDIWCRYTPELQKVAMKDGGKPPLRARSFNNLPRRRIAFRLCVRTFIAQ